jgi:acetylglutamate kinase
MTTSLLEPQRKAEVLVEAQPYIRRFKGSIFVVKMGGAFMESEDARARVAADIAFLATVGIHVVVVHGGGKAINRALKGTGIEPVFKNGLRVTCAKTVEIVSKTLDTEVNTDLCNLLQVRGASPLGIAGQSVTTCDRIVEDDEGNPLDIGFVGMVKRVETKRIMKALEEGLTPVVSPTAVDDHGQVHNVNADVAASHVAMALHARRLVYMCDVPGLLSDPSDHSSLISTLYTDKIPGLKSEGIISSGMAPKVDSAVNALDAGVRRVHFVDGRMPHGLMLEIFTDQGIGTEIVNR